MNTDFIHKSNFFATVSFATLLLAAAPAMSVDLSKVDLSNTTLSTVPQELEDGMEGGATFGHFQVIENMQAKKLASNPHRRDLHIRNQALTGGNNQQQGNDLSALPQAAQNRPVAQKGDFGIFYRHSGSAISAQSAGGPGSKALPVVHNSHTGDLGIVTGIITVKYKKSYNGDAIANRYGYTLRYDLSEARLAYLEISTDMDDILDAYHKLQQDERVEGAGASIDVLEHPNKPM